MRKWFVVRYVRWFWYNLRFQIWWHHTGRYLGMWPNQNDIDFLEAVWRGEI